MGMAGGEWWPGVGQLGLFASETKAKQQGNNIATAVRMWCYTPFSPHFPGFSIGVLLRLLLTSRRKLR